MTPSFDEIVEEARPRVREVLPEDAKSMVEAAPDAIIVDVREPHEWDMGHIAGAIHIPLGDLPAAADPASPTADPRLTGHTGAVIVTQCATGKRSIVAADVLQKLGYADVASMRGGFLFWARQGFPID
jgi:rhodanese-related sulfurtransferase